MIETLKGIATPLLADNIDTEIIMPAGEIMNTFPNGSHEGLFAGWRYIQNRDPNPEFILNKAPNTKILLVGENFGCGSSREQAVWGLLNFGIKCIIGPSFGDIFYTNCIKNCLWLIELPKDKIKELAEHITTDKQNHFISIDFVSSKINSHNFMADFKLNQRFKNCLLGKKDEIESTLENLPIIENFEQERIKNFPWVDPKA